MARKELEEIDSRFRESFFRRIINKLLVGMLITLSYLPFWIIYRISDVLYLFMRFIFRYRWNVITTNLKNSFPEKTEEEISRIRSRFYRHFCDLILESVKMYSMSWEEMSKRIRFVNTEPAKRYFENNQSIIIFGFHHNNWEWCSSIQSQLKHVILMIYNPIRGNEAMEKFLLHAREKWGGECVPVHKTMRTLIQFNANKRLTGLWLAADQTPNSNSKFWTIFLNQETPFFSGPEKIAHSTNQPVVFQHLKKTGRGQYEAEYTVLFEKPAEIEPKEILLTYIRKSEEIIRQEPEYYLWSHRRWKHKRPEGVELTM